MKKAPSKEQIRSEIEHQVDDYLARGGRVLQVERGVSARIGSDGPFSRSGPVLQQPRAERTPLDQVVAQLEARRRPAPPQPATPRAKGPRKKPVLDDFGEIIRWVWEE